ncbi:hypothetical protein [Burkholderia oklahomensis]|uniref:hypothetical protein n=1 Tax=Burkholderia oklahomensis TaxID=342113 RepID=UPI00016A6CEA|nr:hypothetical protein [Burkholderia oklahomensis]
MSGDAGVETKEVVVQPFGRQRDPCRVVPARGGDQQAGVVVAEGRRIGRVETKPGMA